MTWSSLQTAVSIGRLHIVAIAAAAALTFGWIFTGGYWWTAVAFCALDWFLVNLLNRVVDLQEDQKNAIRGTDFVGRHHQAILRAGFGTLAGSFVICALWFPQLFWLRATYHTCLLYTSDAADE